jgi:uncharacterized protein (TIGR02600 family)
MKAYSKNCGFALVLVLTVIVLMAGLIIALFTTATSQRVSAMGKESQMRADALAESTVKIVIGQIADATRSQTTGGTPEKLAWTSQPGMIRTYGSSGDSKWAYKLYSSGQLVVDPASGDNLSTIFGGGSNSDNPTNWSSMPGLFVDLNSPVKNSQGNLIFPIVDPRAMSSTAATGTDSVEGFSYLKSGIDGVVEPAGNPDNQRLPMPVQWLYVLKDGSLTSPDRATSTGGTANWTAGGSNAPTVANPIVGRVAFWTDDESSKININTASEGTYWDVPHVNTDEDKNYARYQPAFNEFQRYPGHPATVALSTVLFPNQTLTTEQKESIYDIVPRVNGGGSKSGTFLATSKIVPDTDRLYASVDELLFAPDRSRQSLLSPASLLRSKFFLSANSRSSEVNLFHLPRVAIWPINANSTDPTYRSAFDKVIAHCGTIDGLPFYFQRSDSTSPTTDYTDIKRNQDLYSYLYNLMGTHPPGTAGTSTFAGKYGTDRAQILTEITDYIRSTNLFDDLLEVEANPSYSLPTKGKEFTAARFIELARAKPGHGQVAPLHIDAPGGEKTMGFGRFPTVSEAAIQFICTAKPDDPSTTKVDESFGSNDPTTNLTLDAGKPLLLNQRRIQAIFLLELFCPMRGNTMETSSLQIRVTGLDNFAIAEATPAKLGFPSRDITKMIYDSRYCGGDGRGGEQGYLMPLMWFTDQWNPWSFRAKYLPAMGRIPEDSNSSDHTSYTANVDSRYPFVSLPVTVTIDPAAKQMTFSGGQIVVELFSGADYGTATSDSNLTKTLVQTVTIKFPGPTTIPVPDLDTTPLSSLSGNPNDAKDFAYWSFNQSTHGRTWTKPTSQATVFNPNYWISSKDVVRSMIAADGDFRMAFKQDVEASIFQPHPKYTESGTNLAHSLRSGAGPGPTGATLGKLVTAANYLYTNPWGSYDYSPAVPPKDPLTPRRDWDNGFATALDGAFINKPDEGATTGSDKIDSIPYFGTYGNVWNAPSGGAFFSPNRQIPSAGMFGSLPSGLLAGNRWQTLLFRPDTDSHPGAVNPPDHLLLDLFWMPVVEPYAISEPFSTAGKINLNYQILPFTNITRSTALNAALKNLKMLAIPTSAGQTYKSGAGGANWRLSIDVAKTIAAIDDKFQNWSTYVSESEICTIPLIPVNESASSMKGSFWTDHALTGDNMRERPYTELYPLLTTRSDTYTVHYRVQALKKVTGTGVTQFVDPDGSAAGRKDQILSEYRGSTTIQRYIDPTDPTLKDFATNLSLNIDDYYRFRILERKTFAP